MNLSPHRMAVLLAVQRSGGVVAAADLLHISPSAVSQQVRALERESGTRLLDRTPTGAVLTPAGRVLTTAAERIEDELAAATRELVALDGSTPTGLVRVGSFATAVRALLLPGAGEGLNALFTPDWSALRDYKVWMAALGQIFFSLSVGFGIMLTYSSYLRRRRSNLVGTGLVAGFANSAFELLAGIGVFATLGFMAGAQGVGVDELKNITGPLLSFVTFPTVISQMPGGALFGVLFFASFTMAGLTSFISIIQVVAAGVGEKLGLAPKWASLVVGVPAAVVSFVLFATTSGLPDLDVVDAFINNIGVVSSAIIMCVAVAWILRRTRLLQNHLNAVSESRMVGAWWRVLVGVVVPVLLGYMFLQTLWTYVTQGYDEYSSDFIMVFGWGMLLLVAIATAVMTLLPWRTPVDDFTPLELETVSERED